MASTPQGRLTDAARFAGSPGLSSRSLPDAQGGPPAVAKTRESVRRTQGGSEGRVGVDHETVLHHLEELAKKLGVDVRYEAAAGHVGKGVLRGQKIAVIDARLRVPERVAALASILADEPTNGLYLPPAVRAWLDRSLTCRPSENGNGADQEAGAVS